MKMIFDSQREIDFTIGKFHHGYLQGQGVQYQKGKFFLKDISFVEKKYGAVFIIRRVSCSIRVNFEMISMMGRAFFIELTAA